MLIERIIKVNAMQWNDGDYYALRRVCCDTWNCREQAGGFHLRRIGDALRFSSRDSEDRSTCHIPQSHATRHLNWTTPVRPSSFEVILAL